MIQINVVKWLTLAFFAWALWHTAPAWGLLAGWLIAQPPVLWFGGGLTCGLLIRHYLGWNAALRLRREQAIEKVDAEFERDKKRIV